MLQQRLSDIMTRALDCAVAAEHEAASAPTAALRLQYERVARSWRILARSFEFSEKMRQFLTGRIGGTRSEPATAAATEYGTRALAQQNVADLQSISQEAAYCWTRARECKALAEQAPSVPARRDYLDLEIRWAVLGETYESSHWLDQSTNGSLRRLRRRPCRKSPRKKI
jgi:hypothetical protein